MEVRFIKDIVAEELIILVLVARGFGSSPIFSHTMHININCRVQFLSLCRNVQPHKQFRFIMQIIVYDALSACVSSGHVRSLQPHVALLVRDFCTCFRFTMHTLMWDFCLKQYATIEYVGTKHGW